MEKYDRDCFDWSIRRDKLLTTIRDLNADVLSLVELDVFDDFHAALKSSPTFYSGTFKKRPRSADGCGIFWRESKFEKIAEQGVDLEDRRAKGESRHDRCCLLVLLRYRLQPRKKVIVISTHLARKCVHEKNGCVLFALVACA